MVHYALATQHNLRLAAATAVQAGFSLYGMQLCFGTVTENSCAEIIDRRAAAFHNQ